MPNARGRSGRAFFFDSITPIFTTRLANVEESIFLPNTPKSRKMIL